MSQQNFTRRHASYRLHYLKASKKALTITTAYSYRHHSPDLLTNPPRLKMCIAGQVRYSCDHLGRKLGYQQCIWFKLADRSVRLGIPHHDPRLLFIEQRCAQAALATYFDKERKCRACMRADREKEEKLGGEGDEEERETQERERMDIS